MWSLLAASQIIILIHFNFNFFILLNNFILIIFFCFTDLFYFNVLINLIIYLNYLILNVKIKVILYKYE